MIAEHSLTFHKATKPDFFPISIKLCLSSGFVQSSLALYAPSNEKNAHYMSSRHYFVISYRSWGNKFGQWTYTYSTNFQWQKYHFSPPKESTNFLVRLTNSVGAIFLFFPPLINQHYSRLSLLSNQCNEPKSLSLLHLNQII